MEFIKEAKAWFGGFEDGAKVAVKAAMPLLIAYVLNKILQKMLGIPRKLDTPRTRTYFSVARSALTTFLYLIAVYYAFTLFEINVTPLFASAGIVGVVVGLGVRSFIEDFFAGFFILSQDTVSVGDYVRIGDTEGITEALGLRTTQIRSHDGSVHTFPNREIRKIINFSRRQQRVTVEIQVKANQPIDKVLEVLETCLKKTRKNRTLSSVIESGSAVQGVDRISSGTYAVTVLLRTKAPSRHEAARHFRYLALKELAKAKIALA